MPSGGDPPLEGGYAANQNKMRMMSRTIPSGGRGGSTGCAAAAGCCWARVAALVEVVSSSSV